MASSSFVLRCKTEKGSHTLNNLTCNSTLAELKQRLHEITNLSLSRMKILSGYPPKPLPLHCDEKTLLELNINAGDALILETLKEDPSFEEIANTTDNLTSAGNEKTFETKATENPAAPVFEFDYTAHNSALKSRFEMFPEYLYTIDSFLNILEGIMMRYEVKSDNSCLFNSIFYAISKGQYNREKSLSLREVVAQFVVCYPQKYTESVLSMKPDDYCKFIRNPDQWGGYIELTVLSEYLEIEIVAIDVQSLISHHVGQGNDFQFRIYLIFDGIHYDPLHFESLTGEVQTIFPVNEESFMKKANEVAREAHASKQFVDFANFKIVCNICKERLRGQKELQEHAVKTGHTDFGEI